MLLELRAENYAVIDQAVARFGPGSDDILLRREIAADGKGRVFVNNQPATAAVLRKLAPELGLIHSQGETLGSFDQAQQRTLLGRVGDVSTEAVAAAFAAWRSTTERLAELQTS